MTSFRSKLQEFVCMVLFVQPPQAVPKRDEGEPTRLAEQPSSTPRATAGAGAGITVPDYELVQRIGAGAYGEVWLARSVLGQLRAVKLVFRSRFNDERPFQREFEGIERFEPISRSHPSQLAILHVGKNESAGCFYYVMELADDANSQRSDGLTECRRDEQTQAARPSGPTPQHSNTPRLHHSSSAYLPHTLRHDLERRGRLPITECVQIGLSLTTALGHLHQHGLVHRDIKPSNVIFVNGAPKLADIGLVAETGDMHSIVGTEGYLPPEGPGTPQADIFSLGKVLYEMSTGMDRRRFSELPEDLRSWRDRSSVVEFNEIVLKACAKDPACRYQSAEEMRQDLALLQKGRSVKRRRAGRQLWEVTKKTAVAILMVALLAAAINVFQRRGSVTDLRSPVPEVNALVEQGNFCLLNQQTSNATELFNKAIQLDPKFVPAYFGLFRADMSPVVAAKLAELAQDSAESRIASARIKWTQWRFREALEDAHEANNLRAVSTAGRYVAHNMYGFFLVQSGDPTAALVQYRLAEKLMPQSPNLVKHLGHPYYAMHKLDLALAQYQKSIDLESRFMQGHYWKGRVCEDMTNFAVAIKEFVTQEQLAGEYDSERKVFYEELRAAVELGGAKAYWTKHLDFALKEPKQDLYRIATLYARLGDTANAYDFLNRACEKKSFEQGLMFDLCWDHNDPQFQAIARRIGLLQ